MAAQLSVRSRVVAAVVSLMGLSSHTCAAHAYVSGKITVVRDVNVACVCEQLHDGRLLIVAMFEQQVPILGKRIEPRVYQRTNRIKAIAP